VILYPYEQGLGVLWARPSLRVSTLKFYIQNVLKFPQQSRRMRYCKKVALRGDKSPANLHAVERRSDLPRRACTITDDNGDTIFVNEVQTKPTSPGHDYGRSSPNCNTGRSGIPAICRLPPASLSLCRHGYNSSPPLIFMRRLGLQSMTRTLPYTVKYNSSLIVTGLYKYSTQYLTNSTLTNIPPP
jgi:hypothetical protein